MLSQKFGTCEPLCELLEHVNFVIEVDCADLLVRWLADVGARGPVFTRYVQVLSESIVSLASDLAYQVVDFVHYPHELFTLRGVIVNNHEAPSAQI